MVEWKVSFEELGENAAPWLTVSNMLEDLLPVGASVLISFKPAPWAGFLFSLS